MRKSFDSLSGIVSGELGREPTGGEVFVFLHKRRSHIKLLHWERDGFSLYYKRLEKGTFTPPVPAEDGSILWPELVLMLEGIKAEKIVRKPRYCVPEKR